MSISNIFLGGKGDWSLGLINVFHSFADCFEIWETQNLQHSDIVLACTGIDLHLTLP